MRGKKGCGGVVWRCALKNKHKERCLYFGICWEEFSAQMATL